MNCPNCGNKMLRIVYPVVAFYDQVDGDIIYDDREEHICSLCAIKYRDNNWDIPEHIKASDKQIKTAVFISNILQKEKPVDIKKLLWQFIKDNIATAIEVYKQREECLDEINMDLYSEYFDEQF